MNIPYSFHPQLLLRTPRLPLFGHLDEETIISRLDDPIFLEAIYLASPVLYDECMKWKSGQGGGDKERQKLLRSLTKYFTRMSSRCTPFGLFSGCNVLQWQEGVSNITLDASATRRHTRLDMHYLCALAQQLAGFAGIREHLLYYPNNSNYAMGDERRYVEYRYVNGRRSHQITSVLASPYLDRVLQEAKEGATISMLAAQLQDGDISGEEASTFVHEMISAQLLVNELEPAITGDEFIYQVQRVLERIQSAAPHDGVATVIQVLQEVNRLLHEIDNAPHNSAAQYRQVSALLDQLEVPYEENKLFQTDIIRVTTEAGFDAAIQQQLLAGLALLNRMAVPREQENLQSFIRRYYERYEDKEMPLLEVMDTETGIGYLAKGGEDNAPLLEAIGMPSTVNSEGNVRWGLIEKYLVNKVNDAYETGAYSTEIAEEEMKHLNNTVWQDLCPSLSVMFRLVDTGQPAIVLEQAGGASAANLLGRFAHADEGIRQLVCDITRREQENDPEVVYAEIIHLPESRVGNILLHPVFRDYEIPYLAKSSLDAAHQLDAGDLMVSVKNNRIILRSKRLNKQVVPRLSTAHNYSNNSLPVYHFLCDLQAAQHRVGLFFHWGSLRSQYKFLPRVTSKQLILSPASWRFLRSDFEPLLDVQHPQWKDMLAAFRKQWRVPRFILLADGDNEMLVDLENDTLVKLWIETIRNRSGLELKEYLQPQSGAVKDQHGHSYANQLVAVLIKQTPSYNGHPAIPRVMKQAQPQRSFTLGSEWLYYKCYCGARTADRILSDAVYPAVKELLAAQHIDQFFFIRYNDPEFHIRLRFHLPDTQRLGEVSALLHGWLRPFEQQGYIWKTQADTYNRELERYGHNSISLAETLFFHDSMATLEMLDNTWGDERDQIRWIWILRVIDELLDVFGYTLTQKLKFTEALKNAFAAEFHADKLLKTQLNNKYRDYRKEIEEIMDRRNDADSVLYPILELLQRKNEAMRPVAAQLLELQAASLLERPLDDLMSSYVHMLVNRVIPSRQRVHEMVIYDLLHQYYRGLNARQQNNNGKKTIIQAA
ncbi:hypothetical protein F0L74_28910 [Chitinophaga agrisoli]|uniref:Thiopeptide-type bacteriocin biosynthesis protein n=1 Tax=Chitinophaga agrisoli TaxID=2607653 RepID=A0A5B2VND6_9BACT|nr:lantibiotic dehydratase [Chitinophaga agrisoli]KAA2240190.1 hypothetical protein F0L74_28910 [Chitinophaga agrisoli]